MLCWLKQIAEEERLNIANGGRNSNRSLGRIEIIIEILKKYNTQIQKEVEKSREDLNEEFKTYYEKEKERRD